MTRRQLISKMAAEADATIGQKLDSGIEASKAFAGKVKGKVKATASTVKDTATNAASTVKDTATNAAGKAKAQASIMGNYANNTVKGVGASTRNMLNSWRERLSPSTYPIDTDPSEYGAINDSSNTAKARFGRILGSISDNVSDGAMGYAAGGAAAAGVGGLGYLLYKLLHKNKEKQAAYELGYKEALEAEAQPNTKPGLLDVVSNLTNTARQGIAAADKYRQSKEEAVGLKAKQVGAAIGRASGEAGSDRVNEFISNSTGTDKAFGRGVIGTVAGVGAAAGVGGLGYLLYKLLNKNKEKQAAYIQGYKEACMQLDVDPQELAILTEKFTSR